MLQDVRGERIKSLKIQFCAAATGGQSRDGEQQRRSCLGPGSQQQMSSSDISSPAESVGSVCLQRLSDRNQQVVCDHLIAKTHI